MILGLKPLQFGLFDSMVDKEKIRDMLDSLIESPKSKMSVVSSEMAAFGGDELIEEVPMDTAGQISSGGRGIPIVG